MAELPRSGVPWSYPGVPTSDVQDEKVETSEVCNDFKVAVEASLGPDAWQILYPDSRLAVSPGCKVLVQLRDDPGVYGSCIVNAGSLLLSRDFGGFSGAAANFVQREAEAAAFESHLRKKRKLEIDSQLHEEVNRAALKRQRYAIISIAVATAALLVAMISCAVWALFLVKGSADLSAGKNTEWILEWVDIGSGWTEGLSLSFDWTQEHWPLAALSGTFALLCCCACYGICGFGAAEGGSDEAAELQDSVQRVQPALQGYKEEGVMVKDVIDPEALELGTCDWRQLPVFVSLTATLCVGGIGMGAMAVFFHIEGLWMAHPHLWV